MNNTPFLRYNQNQNTIEYSKANFSKSFDFSPWGGIEGFLEASRVGGAKGSQYRVFVPDMLRATDMTAAAISSMPFEILRNKTVIDSSNDWQNKIGGIANPHRLIYNIAASLCGGAAYVIPEGTDNVAGNLRFVPSSTIEYTFDLNGISTFYYNSQFGTNLTLTPDEIIHFFLPDPDLENLPARAHPVSAATPSAWRIMGMNNTINVQSERGFIPPTLVSAEGLIKSEAEKTETWFNRMVKNPLREVWKIVNASKINIIRLGSGMDELKTVFVELKRDASEDIGKSFGIPAALFMSDKAFASEYDALIRQWYSASIFVTIYQTIQETFNEQFFSRFDCQMKFKPETLDAFQEDETKRAAAFRDYVSARIRPSIVAQMLGLELPEGIEYSALDENYDKPEAEKPVNPLGDPALPQQQAPAPSAMNIQSPPQEKPVPMRAVVLSPDEMKDLTVWYDKALAWFRRGKGNAVDWESKHLRESIAAPIRLKLAEAGSESEIMRAFRVNEELQDDTPRDDILKLAEAINKAVDTPRTEPVSVVINNSPLVDKPKSTLMRDFISGAFAPKE